MDTMMKVRANCLLFSLLAAGTAVAHAGTASLNPAQEAQLAAWLGEGPLKFTSIYSKALGDTSLNFHQAADGKGRTISVMEATNELGQTWLVGGYNPQSWSTSGTFNMTPDDAQRTGFVFNLTTSTIHRQILKSYSLDTIGAYQTYNAASFGPTFGLGNDLYVPRDLTHGGYSLLYSYADPHLSNLNTSILDGTLYPDHPNITYGAMQVYTIAAVPEPDSKLMWLAGAGLLAWTVRRKAGRAA